MLILLHLYNYYIIGTYNSTNNYCTNKRTSLDIPNIRTTIVNIPLAKIRGYFAMNMKRWKERSSFFIEQEHQERKRQVKESYCLTKKKKKKKTEINCFFFSSLYIYFEMSPNFCQQQHRQASTIIASRR